MIVCAVEVQCPRLGPSRPYGAAVNRTVIAPNAVRRNRTRTVIERPMPDEPVLGYDNVIRHSRGQQISCRCGLERDPLSD